MAESILDAAETYDRLDPHGLYGRIAALPDQVAQASDAARALALPAVYREADRIVVLGMGGSGIGGALLQGLAVDIGAKTQVSVVRGYVPPAYVGPRTLVLASSNSGNTEEIVASLGAAADAGAMCVVLTTGGRLGAMARERGLPALIFDWDGEPRSALGWSTATLLAICSGLGLLPDMESDLRNALAAMRALTEQCARDMPEPANAAKQLARRLAGRLPVIVGAQALAPVAYRWRTQINENAKSWAIADELSEMNHNAPLGFGAPRALVPLLHAVVLRHASMHPRIRLRVDATLQQLDAAGVAAEVLDVPGASLLSQVLWAVQLGDFASYYMGLLNGVEPSPVAALDWLKAYMAAR